MGAIYNKILQKLATLGPVELRINDETYKHAGHLEKDTVESHFSINIVASAFKDLSKIERHRIIYKLLDHEMKNGIHALAIKAFAPEEIEEK